MSVISQTFSYGLQHCWEKESLPLKSMLRSGAAADKGLLRVNIKYWTSNFKRSCIFSARFKHSIVDMKFTSGKTGGLASLFNFAELCAVSIFNKSWEEADEDLKAWTVTTEKSTLSWDTDEKANIRMLFPKPPVYFVSSNLNKVGLSFNSLYHNLILSRTRLNIYIFALLRYAVCRLALCGCQI